VAYGGRSKRSDTHRLLLDRLFLDRSLLDRAFLDLRLAGLGWERPAKFLLTPRSPEDRLQSGGRLEDRRLEDRQREDRGAAAELG
jgi:hypothetical protein